MDNYIGIIIQKLLCRNNYTVGIKRLNIKDDNVRIAIL